MSFDPSGGGIANANDVALNNPANADVLSYDGSLAKWTNDTESSAYRTVQSQGSSKLQQPSLNFGSGFLLTNSGVSGSGATNVSLYPSFRMRATTPQDLTSTGTTMQDVMGASFTIPANTGGADVEYEMEVRVKYESTLSNDIRFDVMFPTGVTADGGMLGLSTGATANSTTAQVNNTDLNESSPVRPFGGNGVGGAVSALHVYISATITVPAGNTGGVVQVQAAADTATDTGPGSTRILSVAGMATQVS